MVKCYYLCLFLKHLLQRRYVTYQDISPNFVMCTSNGAILYIFIALG